MGNDHPGTQSTKLASLLTQELHWTWMVCRRRGAVNMPKAGSHTHLPNAFPKQVRPCTFCVLGPLIPNVTVKVNLYQPGKFYTQTLWAGADPETPQARPSLREPTPSGLPKC